MPKAHTTLNFLPLRGFPQGTSKAQFLTCRNRVHRSSRTCAFAREADGSVALGQVYHKSTFLAIGRAKLAARVQNVEPNIAPPRASSAHLKVAVSARRFL